MNRKLVNIALGCLVFTMSCSKDQDDISPSILMSSPIEMQQIMDGETVRIIGTITDDRNIERITVTLRDKNNTPVLSTITKTLGQKNTERYALDASFIFSDLHMVSGEYDFNITVSDGENTTTKYIPISFKEAQKKREGIFVVGNGGNFSSIYLLDNGLNGSFYKAINGDFIGASVDANNQQLINVAKTTGSISATGLNNGGDVWSVPVAGNSPTPFFTAFYYNNQRIYMGKRDGGVIGYDENGNPNFSTGTSVNAFMKSAFIHDDQYFVMVEEPVVTGNAGSIALAWLYSGVRIQQTAIHSDVRGMYSSTQNTIILLANDASLNAEIIFYDISSGATYSPFSISSLGKIDDCLEVSNGIYLVAANGDLSSVNINDHSILGYLTGVPADRIWLDNLANELYVSKDDLLSVYDYSTRALKGTYTHTEDIEEVLFWYNK